MDAKLVTIRLTCKILSTYTSQGTKAEQGAKDENISPAKAAMMIGEEYAKQIEELSLSIYSKV